jgi:high frequency lysogenization protein
MSQPRLEQEFTPRQARLIALAAVFQSAQLVHLFATQGRAALHTHQREFDQLIHASLSDDLYPPTRYGYPASLRLGLRTLESCLTQPFTSTPAPKRWRYSESMRYTLALLTLERKIYRQTKLTGIIEQQLPVLTNRISFFDGDVQHSAVMAGFAQLYLDTAGSLKMRLKIQGQQAHLTEQANIDRIRACLFAGVQAAHLWHQLGGRRWSFMFGRRHLLEDLRELALRYYRDPSMVR